MVRSILFRQILLTVTLCCVFATGWAVPVENTVVVEINTIDMTEDKIENVIAEPIELLLGALDDVFMVYAKYLPNKAVISVKFSQTSAEPDVLVSRVKNTINSYMEKLPESIDSISVILGEPSESLSADEPQQVELNDGKEQKNNRNNSASEKTIEPEPAKSLSDSSAVIKNEPGVIRSVEKRVRAGRYLGSIESSNEFLPVITTLLPASNNSDDVVAGKYFMNEQDEIIVGKISGCYNNTGNVLTCQWRDKYGTGGVDFIFTPDYSSFNGRWSIIGKEGAYKWSGIKVKDQ